MCSLEEKMMKKAALFLLAGGMVLSGCGYDAGLGGNGVIYNEKGVGVSVDDSGSAETATKKVDEKTGKETWTKTSGKGVTFTFMTRPGADAAYITGYKVTSRKVNGRETVGTPVKRYKMHLYLTSGYTCKERTALHSCVAGADGTVIGNGVPVKHNIYFEGGLANLVVSTNRSVAQESAIEFFGYTANGAEFTVKADSIFSKGIKLGNQ